MRQNSDYILGYIGLQFVQVKMVLYVIQNKYINGFLNI